VSRSKTDDSGYVSGKVTAEHKRIRDGLRIGATNIAIMTGRLQGCEIGMLVATVPAGKDTDIYPVAVLCDEVFLEQFGDTILDPDGRPLPSNKKKRRKKDKDLDDLDMLIKDFVNNEEIPSGNTLERGLAALEKLRREGRIR
jgi:hypothetical protein